jgi:hypothetical protein
MPPNPRETKRVAPAQPRFSARSLRFPAGIWELPLGLPPDSRRCYGPEPDEKGDTCLGTQGVDPQGTVLVVVGLTLVHWTLLSDPVFTVVVQPSAVQRPGTDIPLTALRICGESRLAIVSRLRRSFFIVSPFVITAWVFGSPEPEGASLAACETAPFGVSAPDRPPCHLGDTWSLGDKRPCSPVG